MIKVARFASRAHYGSSKTPKTLFGPVFRPQTQLPTPAGGYLYANFFFKNHLIYYMEHLPATLYIFRTPTAPCTHYLRKNVLFQNRPLRAKYDDLSYEIKKSILAVRRFLSTFLTSLGTSKKVINFILANICIMLAKNHNCASRAQKCYPTHSHKNAYFLKNII